MTVMCHDELNEIHSVVHVPSYRIIAGQTDRLIDGKVPAIQRNQERWWVLLHQ